MAAARLTGTAASMLTAAGVGRRRMGYGQRWGGGGRSAGAGASARRGRDVDSSGAVDGRSSQHADGRALLALRTGSPGVAPLFQVVLGLPDVGDNT
jgi:hypothetical protein